MKWALFKLDSSAVLVLLSLVLYIFVYTIHLHVQDARWACEIKFYMLYLCKHIKCVCAWAKAKESNTEQYICSETCERIILFLSAELKWTVSSLHKPLWTKTHTQNTLLKEKTWTQQNIYTRDTFVQMR